MTTGTTTAAGGKGKGTRRKPRTSKKKTTAKANGAAKPNGTAAPEQQDLAGGKPPEQQQSKPSAASLNNRAHDEEVLALFTKLKTLKAKRSELNADITATRKAIYNKGHTRDALSYVEKMHAFDDDRREENDVSVMHLRRALRVPMQLEAFEATSPEAAEVTKH